MCRYSRHGPYQRALGSDPAADFDKEWESQATFGVLTGADHTIEGAAVHKHAGVMMVLPDATLAFGAWRIGGRLLGRTDEATGLFRSGRLADGSGELTQFRHADNTADFTQTGRRVSGMAATHDPKCFVAGTLVLAAADGSTVTATSIEDIKIGDWVWSRDEHTGEEGLKPVVTLFRNQADSLVHVTYTSGSAAATLTGTEEHPFWSVSRGSWVPMGELEAGETLALAGGLTATATAVRIERLATPVTVYNFEVADWHTYHVGTPQTGWVYVHNKCDWQKYEDQVRAMYGSTSPSARKFDSIENGIQRTRIADTVVNIKGIHTAIEAKYSGVWTKSIHNPRASIGRMPWGRIHRRELVAQARAYSANFKRVIYHSNSREFITHYSRVFKRMGVKNVEFIFTPYTP